MTIDPYDLNRFIQAQENSYSQAIAELKNGYKQSHWMWFIFPQIKGLGHSEMAHHYAIKSKQEAAEYLNHPMLGPRLRECSEILLGIEDRLISDIMGYPDDLKLKSSMTLFASIAGNSNIFEKVIDKYFNGSKDSKTLELLNDK